MPETVLKYSLPQNWIRYDKLAIATSLINAKAAVMSLTAIPYQRSWAEALQEIELKREVAGTSKIEGADFTDEEFAKAISEDEPEHDMTRSQRQARAAINTYRWIGSLDSSFPITCDFIRNVHRRIVTGCDEDHCAPGQFRGAGENVLFGRPRHRGVEGGKECSAAFETLIEKLNTEYRDHDELIQALALHYHMGALHPFQDGNGRTARAVEALLLRKASLKDAIFVSMSNYYYDEKNQYLACLSEARSNGHDLTPFLIFGLNGIAMQCGRLLSEIRRHVEISLYRDVANKLYARLLSTRKRALAQRQLAIAEKLLAQEKPIDHHDLFGLVGTLYANLTFPFKAYIRDINKLLDLGAITYDKKGDKFMMYARLKWPTEITETDFYKQIGKLPKAKTGVFPI